MAKRTVRINLEKGSPDKFIKLLKAVVAYHESLGAGSPLNSPDIIDMADFKSKLQQADALREESIELRAEAESKMNQAQVLLGIAKGQTINTTGTLYNQIDIVKKLLIARYFGMEESLTPFGFNVVIGTAKGIGRKRKPKN